MRKVVRYGHPAVTGASANSRLIVSRTDTEAPVPLYRAVSGRAVSSSTELGGLGARVALCRLIERGRVDYHS